MIRYEVRAKDLSEHLRVTHAERIKRVVSAIQEAVAVHGPAIAQSVVDETHPLPVDRGDYRRSFDSYDTPTGAVFLNDAAHASIVEKGRRPGRFPPVDVIERWVRRKFRLQASSVQGRRAGVRRRRGARAALNAQYRGVAFLVARKIAREGIPGKHVMARVEARLTPIVEAAMRKAAEGHG